MLYVCNGGGRGGGEGGALKEELHLGGACLCMYPSIRFCDVTSLSVILHNKERRKAKQQEEQTPECFVATSSPILIRQTVGEKMKPMCFALS